MWILFSLLAFLFGSGIFYLIKLQKENNVLLRAINKAHQDKLLCYKILEDLVDVYDETLDSDSCSKILKKFVRRSQKQLKEGGVNVHRRKRTEIDCY